MYLTGSIRTDLHSPACALHVGRRPASSRPWQRVAVVAIAALLATSCSVERRSPAIRADAVSIPRAEDIDLGTAGFGAVAPDPLRLWITAWPGYGLVLVGASTGMLNADGLRVEIAVAADPAQMSAGFKTGIVEAAAMKTFEALRMRSEGAPITIVGLLDHVTRETAILVPSSVADIKDFKGRQISVSRGTSGEFLLSVALHSAALSERDVILADLPIDVGNTELVNGTVVATVSEEPYTTPFLAAHPAFRVLVSGADYAGFLSDALVVRDDIVRDRPGQVAALLKSLERTTEFMATHPVESEKIVGQRLGILPQSAALTLNGIRQYSLAEAKILLSDIPTTIGNVANAARDAGLITRDVDPIAMVDTRFINALG